MPNSKDIFKLQPGATYSVKIVPKDRNSNGSEIPTSFSKVFVVPNTNPDGSPITASNTAVNVYQSTSTVFIGGATMVAASNFFFNQSGMTVWQPGTTASVFYINAKTGDVGLKGNITATSGSIGGFTIGNDKLSASGPGTYVGISGSGTYAFWAGDSNPASAKFWVKSNGDASLQGLTVTKLVAGTAPAIAGLWPDNPNGRAFFAGASDGSGTNANIWITNSGSVFSLGGASFLHSIITDSTIGAGAGNFGVDAQGNLIAKSGSIGGWSITANTLSSGPIVLSSSATNPQIYIGSGQKSNSNTPFYVDSTGYFSLGNKFQWTGSSLFMGDQTGGQVGFQAPTNPTGSSIAIYAGVALSNASAAPFKVDYNGNLTSNSGSIAGWLISSSTISKGSGTSRVVLDSANSRIYIGGGTPNNPQTPFYVDSTGYFSLSNQLTFQPSKGSVQTVSTTANFTNNSAVITTQYDNSASIISQGTLVTGSQIIPTNVRVSSISYGPNATASLTYTYQGTSGNYDVTFSPDGLAVLNVNGTIRGAVESVNPILNKSLFANIVTASINQNASVVRFSTDGHIFSPSSIVTFDNLPIINNLNYLNFNSASGNSYKILETPNSVEFIIAYGSEPLFTSFANTGAGRASIQQLTMGLHTPENTGTSYAHDAGTGIRLNDSNWWFSTNNQFRVGDHYSYLKFNGNSLQIQGGTNYQLQFITNADKTVFGIFKPSSLLSLGDYYSNVYNDQYAASGFTTSPIFKNVSTPFYVDGTGQFSVTDKLVLDNSNLSVTGAINANSLTTNYIVNTVDQGSEDNTFNIISAFSDGTGNITYTVDISNKKSLIDYNIFVGQAVVIKGASIDVYNQNTSVTEQNFSHSNGTFSVFNSNAIGFYNNTTFNTQPYGFCDNNFIISNTTGKLNTAAVNPSLPISYDGNTPNGVINDGESYLDLIKLPPYVSFYALKTPTGSSTPIYGPATGVSDYRKHNAFSNIQVEVPDDGVLKATFKGWLNINPVNTANWTTLFVTANIIPKQLNANIINGNSFLTSTTDNSSNYIYSGASLNFPSSIFNGGTNIVNILFSTNGTPATSNKYIIPATKLFSSSTVAMTNLSKLDTIVNGMYISGSVSGTSNVFSGSIINITSGVSKNGVISIPTYTASLSIPQPVSASFAFNFSPTEFDNGMIIKDVNNNYYQIKSLISPKDVSSSNVFSLQLSAASVTPTSGYISASIYNAVVLDKTFLTNSIYSASALNLFLISNTASTNFNGTASSYYLITDPVEQNYFAHAHSSANTNQFNLIRRDIVISKNIPLKDVPYGGVIVNFDLNGSASTNTGTNLPTIYYGGWMFEYYPYASYNLDTFNATLPSTQFSTVSTDGV